MANLFIAYDLITPGQSYDRVIAAIKSLGTVYQFQLSLWYVNTDHDANAAFVIVNNAMDTNDRLAVINAVGGVVSSWDHPPIDAINAIWSQG